MAGANVTGTVPNANVANFVNVSNANAGTSGTFYPVFVATTGNGALQLDNVGNTISYNPSSGVLTYNTAKVDKVGNDNNGENIEFDGTNNSIRTSVTGLANALVVSNTSVNVNSNLNVTGTITGNGSGLSAIAGANVTGTVANATYATSADSANTAGTVTTNAQPNITSLGNLTSLTVNSNTTGSTTIQLDGNLSVTGNITYELINAYDDGNGVFNTASSKVLNNYPGYGAWENKHYVNDGSNTAYGGFTSFDFTDFIGNSGADPLVSSAYSIGVFSTSADLSNASTQTGTAFSLGIPGIALTAGTVLGGPAFQVNHYGDIGLRFNTRNGNGDARANVAASSYLGNIEWRPAGRNGSGAVSYNTKTSYVASKVDAGYTGANAETVPQGLEFAVVNSSNNRVTHSFYANGNVSFANSVSVAQYLVLANDTAANVANLTGVAGAMITVSDQDYQPAYWSATDNVWKYVSNRANV